MIVVHATSLDVDYSENDDCSSLHATPSKEPPVRGRWLQSWLKGMVAAIVAILADAFRHVGLSLYDIVDVSDWRCSCHASRLSL